MNYNQNEKISQITPSTLVIGIDVAKHKHVARAQDYRGIEFGKRLYFDNRIEGLERLVKWIVKHQEEQEMTDVTIGMEPTGHYWQNLVHFLRARHFRVVFVNPTNVKTSKRLDDNSPTKNDKKDAKVIAQLVKDGRYSVPNLLEGNYAELREGVKVRDQLTKQLMIIENRILNVLDRYFPEFFDVFKDWDGKAAMASLRHFPFPSHLEGWSAEDVVQTWKNYVNRGVGIKKARQLVSAAEKSVGITTALRMAEMELMNLLDQYELYNIQVQTIDDELEELLSSIPGVEHMVAIKGLGIRTVATIVSEVGDFKQYRHPQQLINLAGLSLKEHSSGTYKGQTKISKSGRKKLRRALYLAIRPLVSQNETFKALHAYYTTHKERPLKKQQSLLALCGKLLKALFVIGQRDCAFDGSKLLQGLPQAS